jgi:uncharacterized protein YaiI (UPF0178 family)
MKIWVDADACPVVIKEILYKAAERRRMQLTLVANSRFRIPKSSFIRFLQVPHGQDVADTEIVNKIDSGDLVITADIPLAARVVEKGGLALNPRGEIYSEENIKERPALNPRDKQAFANSLDQLISKYSNKA